MNLAYKLGRLLLLISCISLLTACPYPVYKKLRPEGRALILDDAGKPIAGTKVVMLTRVHPTPIREFDVKITDTEGAALFASRRELQTETIFLHGAVEYFWNWCVEKTGYSTYKTSFSNASEFTEHLTINLSHGNSTTCMPDEQTQ